MSFNILRNAYIRNGSRCKFDSNEGYSVYWDEDENFKNYVVYNNITARLVANDAYFMVTTSSGCNITTASDIDPIDAGVYTHIKLNMRLDIGTNIISPTKGMIEFRLQDDEDWSSDNSVEFDITPDNSYREYVIDMSQKEEWVGNVVRLRISPVLDSQPGTHIFIKYIKVISVFSYACSTSFNSPLCNRYNDYVHPCPYIGSGAKACGTVVEQRLTISSGVNDRLVVNINDFGEQSITLTPVISGSLLDISRDIERNLNLVGVGGYSGAKCYIDGLSLIIESDTHEDSSTIVISEPTSSSVGETLGFFTSSGTQIYTSVAGVEAATRYEEESTYKVSREALDKISSGEYVGGQNIFSIDASKYAPQGGNKDYADVIRENKVEFRYKTFIDYNNPITENGVILKAYFSGDAHTETEFRIYRQRLDGSIHYIYGINFGSNINFNLDKIFEIDCSVRVQKGDLIGIYSASLHSGNYGSKPNFSYYLYDGDLLTSCDIFVLSGYGESGAPIFCRGTEKTDRAVLDFSFEVPVSIESITIQADEETPVEILPLTKLQSGGVGGGPYITGYTGYGADETKAPEWAGLQYLVDGIKSDVNATSSYAYPLWWGGGNEGNYDYTEAGFKLDFCPGVDVVFNIYKVILYFNSRRNIKSFTIDYPYSKNLYDTLQAWKPVCSNFLEVYTDGKLESSERYIYENPAYVTVNRYHQDYVEFGYKNVGFIFDPVQARSIRYRGYLNVDATGVEDYYSETLGKFPIYIDPKIQEIEVFAKSFPEKNLSDNFEIQSSVDDSNYIYHLDIDALSSDTSRFTIGYPVQYLKVIINPTTTVDIKNIVGEIPRDSSRLDSETKYQEIMINASLNKPEESVDFISLINDSNEESNYFINISDENYTPNGCIFWNKVGSEEEIEASEIGPGGIIYKRPNFRLSLGNIALGADAYVMDPNFLRNCPCYVSYNEGASWTNIGGLLVNGNKLAYLTNESTEYPTHQVVYAAIDCKVAYDFLSVSPVSLGSHRFDYGWDTSIYYSTYDTDDPSIIPSQSSLDPRRWRLDQKVGVRWIRVQANSVYVGAGFADGGLKETIAYIRAILDITSKRNKDIGFKWLEESRLVNGISGVNSSNPEGASYYVSSWAGPNKLYYYCVNLGGYFDIASVIVGPTTCADGFGYYDDVSTCSSLDSNLTNPNIAFSNDVTDIPSKVLWRSFGSPPIGSDKWVIYRGTVCDEISVFINDSSSITKALYETPRFWESNVGVPYIDLNDYCNIPGGVVCVDYEDSLGPAGEKLSTTIDMGADNNLAVRDALGLCLYISDITQLDIEYGYFKLGRNSNGSITFNDQSISVDPSNYYLWRLSDIYSSLVNGWNMIFLPFGIDNKVGDPNFVISLSGSGYGSYENRSRFSYFEFAFRGVENNSQFTVKLDSLEILRTNYPELSNGMTGVYLVGPEYLKFNINGFDPMRGCIEFFLDPDWSKNISCNTCKDVYSHTVFRFINSDGYLMEALMTVDGMSIFLSDGNNLLHHIDNSEKNLSAGVSNHFAISWDFLTNSTAVIEVYVNGYLSSFYSKSSVPSSFNMKKHTNIYLLFGGNAWSGNADYEISGVDGVLSNIKVYNYTKRLFFDSINGEINNTQVKSRELVELSIDGSNFFGYGRGLPLLIRDVVPGDFISFYIRSKNLLESSKGAYNRKSHIEVVRVKK